VRVRTKPVGDDRFDLPGAQSAPSAQAVLKSKSSAVAYRVSGSHTRGGKPCREVSLVLISLRKPIADLVVIAFVGHEDVARQAQAGWLFETPNIDAHIITAVIPKQS